MYEFVSGPLVWIAFILFIAGLALQFVRVRKLAKKAEVRFGTAEAVNLLQLRLIRNHDGALLPDVRRKYVFSSLLHWLVPFASRNMRMGYEATFVTLAFHACLLLLPILSHRSCRDVLIRMGTPMGDTIPASRRWFDRTDADGDDLLPRAALDAP